MVEYRKSVHEYTHGENRGTWRFPAPTVKRGPTTVTRLTNYRAYGRAQPYGTANLNMRGQERFPGPPRPGYPDEHQGAFADLAQDTYLPGSMQLEDHNWDLEQKGKHPVLFTQSPGILETLYSDPAMRHTAPTLLAMAYNDSGHDIQPSDDLSPHSARLVRKAVARGWVEPPPDNPDIEPSNSSDLYPVAFTDEKDQWGRPASPMELAGAKKTLRDLLRGPDTAPIHVEETKHLSPQFQPTLPGF